MKSCKSALIMMNWKNRLASITISTVTVVSMVLLALSTNAQDTIYFDSGAPVVIAKILEVNPTNLKYKKYSNTEGPTYTVERGEIEKVVYANGEIERYSAAIADAEILERQSSPELMPSSRVCISYVNTKDERNVNGVNARETLTKIVTDKTTCAVVSSIENADFEIQLFVTEESLQKRYARIDVIHLASNTRVFETDWYSAYAKPTNGMQGSKAAMAKLINKHLCKEYPEICR